MFLVCLCLLLQTDVRRVRIILIGGNFSILVLRASSWDDCYSLLFFSARKSFRDENLIFSFSIRVNDKLIDGIHSIFWNLGLIW